MKIINYCECEHISHMDNNEGHPYGARAEVKPVRLRDMGIWVICEHCKTHCHKDNVEVKSA